MNVVVVGVEYAATPEGMYWVNEFERRDSLERDANRVAWELQRYTSYAVDCEVFGIEAKPFEPYSDWITPQQFYEQA